LFKIDELFAPEILEKSPKHRARAQWELPESFLPALAARSRDLGIQFACTPFSLRAVDVLGARLCQFTPSFAHQPAHVDAYM
jgi:N-acetylneuraminate synthase